MIATLAGTVKATTSNSAVIDVGGIGILVQISPRLSAALNVGASAHLHTLLIVREDSLTLFGFERQQDRELFEILLSVTGIGPKVAQSALSVYDAAEIVSAIMNEKPAVLERIPGLGKKGAQRLILELKEKVKNLNTSTSGSSRAAGWRDQVSDALIGLGFTAQLDFYENASLSHIVRRSAQLLEVGIDDDAIDEIGSRSRGTPRVANRLLRRVRDYAQVRGDGHIRISDARDALAMYEVDESGLDRMDRSLLEVLVKRFAGGPVGISTLAMAIGEEAETIESLAEPFLVRMGFLARTPRGRVATELGWNQLGLKAPADLATSQVSNLASLFDTPTNEA